MAEAKPKTTAAKRGRKPVEEKLVKTSLNLPASLLDELRFKYDMEPRLDERGKPLSFSKWVALAAIDSCTPRVETRATVRREPAAGELGDGDASAKSLIAEAAYTKRVEAAAARGAYAASRDGLGDLGRELGQAFGELSARTDRLESLIVALIDGGRP